jgi:hypothetical protein
MRPAGLMPRAILCCGVIFVVLDAWALLAS